MISKLCNFNIRSELIVYIIEKELKLNPNQQIMILAHNKCLLIYLFKAIEYRKIGTIGYYIGGMKQKDLKISESKQIIIATYSMASEGLDIKTLTTLVLATPKTDIEQAVGRIMRINHSNPLIIDIIDQHELFKKQWAKRRLFYQKNNYSIISAHDYHSNQWNDIIYKSSSKNDNNKSLINNNEIDSDSKELPLIGKCMISLE